MLYEYNSVMPGIPHACTNGDEMDDMGIADEHGGSGMDPHRSGGVY